MDIYLENYKVKCDSRMDNLINDVHVKNEVVNELPLQKIF